MDRGITAVEGRFEKPPDYRRAERREVLAMVPPHARRILDVGCGAGSTWRGFAGEVHGIESDAAAAREAREVLSEVVTGDVETLELPWPAGSFDCIVCADVLEHLRDPWGLLLRLRPLLAPGGSLVSSVPNVRHYRVVRALVLGGEFAYTRFGILDIDHLRFFTRKSLERMLRECGFAVRRIERVRQASLKFRVLDALLLGALRDFLARQFVVVAEPRDAQRSGSE